MTRGAGGTLLFMVAPWGGRQRLSGIYFGMSLVRWHALEESYEKTLTRYVSNLVLSRAYGTETMPLNVQTWPSPALQWLLPWDS